MVSLCVDGVSVVGGVDIFVGVSCMDWIVGICVVLLLVLVWVRGVGKEL